MSHKTRKNLKTFYLPTPAEMFLCHTWEIFWSVQWPLMIKTSHMSEQFVYYTCHYNVFPNSKLKFSYSIATGRTLHLLYNSPLCA